MCKLTSLFYNIIVVSIAALSAHPALACATFDNPTEYISYADTIFSARVSKVTIVEGTTTFRDYALLDVEIGKIYQGHISKNARIILTGSINVGPWLNAAPTESLIFAVTHDRQPVFHTKFRDYPSELPKKLPIIVQSLCSPPLIFEGTVQNVQNVMALTEGNLTDNFNWGRSLNLARFQASPLYTPKVPSHEIETHIDSIPPINQHKDITKIAQEPQNRIGITTIAIVGSALTLCALLFFAVLRRIRRTTVES